MKKVLGVFLVLIAGCSQDPHGADQSTPTVAAPTPQPSAETAREVVGPGDDINPRLLRRFRPLPSSFEANGAPLTEALTDLGRNLFYDPRLSKSGDISCNSCHDLAQYGVDGTRTSVGFHGQHGSRNAPTVYNAAGFFLQFWDGRAPNVEEQAKGPIANPVEMAMTDSTAVVTTLKSVPAYVDAFHAAFPEDSDPVTLDNTGRAIGAFERKLVTPGRWDRFLKGDASALSAEEKEGLKTFMNVGCMVCHTGAYLGGSMFERAGVVEPWPNQEDHGRANVTKAPGDQMMFKVPTLRNVEKTAPYFHDGSAKTLDEAVKMMGRYQLGLDLSPSEVASIVTWLRSLTGELPMAYIQKPKPY